MSRDCMLNGSNSTLVEARVDDYKLNTHPQICPHSNIIRDTSRRSNPLDQLFKQLTMIVKQTIVSDIETEFTL